MSSRTLILLHGPAGSGKSSVARKVCELSGAHTAALADPLKHWLHRYCGVQAYLLWGESKLRSELVTIKTASSAAEDEETGDLGPLIDQFSKQHANETMTVRLAITSLGDVLPRRNCEYVHKLLIQTHSLFVVPDLRYVEDLRYFKERPELARVVAIKLQRPGSGYAQTHPSDYELPDELFDFILQNEGSVAHTATEIMRRSTVVDPS